MARSGNALSTSAKQVFLGPNRSPSVSTSWLTSTSVPSARRWRPTVWRSGKASTQDAVNEAVTDADRGIDHDEALGQ